MLKQRYSYRKGIETQRERQRESGKTKEKVEPSKQNKK